MTNGLCQWEIVGDGEVDLGPVTRWGDFFQPFQAPPVKAMVGLPPGRFTTPMSRQ